MWGNERKMHHLQTFILIIIAIILAFFVLNGCTYSINLAHTEGHANDLIDENQRANADVKPNLTIPAL